MQWAALDGVSEYDGGGDGGPEEGQGEDHHGADQVDEVIHAQGHHQAKYYLIILTINCK